MLERDVLDCRHFSASSMSEMVFDESISATAVEVLEVEDPELILDRLQLVPGQLRDRLANLVERTLVRPLLGG